MNITTNKPWVRKTALATGIAAGLLLTAGNAVSIEEASYEVIKTEDQFELREYEPQIVAEVVVQGDFKRAGNRAFRPLFRYIDGNNTSREKIAMTAPVSQAAQGNEGEKIAMTTPVGQMTSADGWSISFMMPAEYTMESIPVPADPTVIIREIPEQRVAAIRYSGTWSESNYQEHLASLLKWVDSQGLTVTGDPVWARYNAPFTPWFMRRNEILLRIDS